MLNLFYAKTVIIQTIRASKIQIKISLPKRLKVVKQRKLILIQVIKVLNKVRNDKGKNNVILNILTLKHII